MGGMFFLNQIAEYLYIAFQSAGNFSIFHAATSWAPLVQVAVWHSVTLRQRQE